MHYLTRYIEMVGRKTLLIRIFRASGYSRNAVQRSSLFKTNKSVYPTDRTFAVLRFPFLLPAMFKMLSSPKTAPSESVANTSIPSSVTTWKLFN